MTPTTIEHRVLDEMARIAAEYKLTLTTSSDQHGRQSAYAMDGFEARLYFSYEFYRSIGVIRFGGPAAESWHHAHPDERRWYEHRINFTMSYSGDGEMPPITAMFALYRDLLTIATSNVAPILN